jgi:hypothetical protein
MLPTRPGRLIPGREEIRHVQPKAGDDLFLGASGEAFHEYNTVLGLPYRETGVQILVGRAGGLEAIGGRPVVG